MYVFSLLGAILDDVSVLADEFEWQYDGDELVCYMNAAIYNGVVDEAVRSIVDDIEYSWLEIYFKDDKISAIRCSEKKYEVGDDIEKFISNNGQDEMYTMMCREVVRLGAIYA